jgi:hypothetical protein
MAIDYPSAIDVFTNPSGTSTLDSPDHALQHSDANDAIEAIEAVIGTTAGTSVLKDFSAGEFAVRQEGGTVSPGTLTFDSPTLGTPAITGGTATGLTLAGTPVLDATSAIPFYNDSIHRQAIINGNFDVWQRGTTVTNPAKDTFISDRWKIYTDVVTPPTNVIHSRQILTSGDIPGAFYYYRIAPDGAGTTGSNLQALIQQFIEQGTRLLCGDGKKVTISFWARSSIANKKIGVRTIQNYGTGGSPSSQEIINGTAWTLTSTWTKYTYTFTTNTLSGKTFGTDNNDYISLGLAYFWDTGIASRFGTTGTETYVGSGTIDIAQVQLCAGDVALPFMPKSFEEELRACQRYYEKSYTYSVVPGTDTNLGMTSFLPAVSITAAAGVTFCVEKRIVPTTVRIYSKLGTASKISKNDEADIGTTVVAAAIGSKGWRQVIDSGNGLTANAYYTYHWTADAEL